MLSVLLMLQFSGPLDVEGVWQTGNGRAHVEIMESGDSIRGQIIWYANYEADLAAGTVGDSVLGKTLLEDFDKTDDKWRRGKIYDLRNDRTYRAAIARSGEDTLIVDGCLSLFCREQEWTRVPEADVVRLTKP
ncbi:MAG: DUF2147 domain-containing protein [Pseudomonadota bacterium]